MSLSTLNGQQFGSSCANLLGFGAGMLDTDYRANGWSQQADGSWMKQDPNNPAARIPVTNDELNFAMVQQGQQWGKLGSEPGGGVVAAFTDGAKQDEQQEQAIENAEQRGRQEAKGD